MPRTLHGTHTQYPASTDTLLLEAGSNTNFFLGWQGEKTALKAAHPKE